MSFVVRDLSINLSGAVQAKFPFAAWHVHHAGRVIFLMCSLESTRGIVTNHWHRLIELRDLDGSTSSVIEWTRNVLEKNHGPAGEAYKAHLAQQEADALAGWIPAVESKKKESRL